MGLLSFYEVLGPCMMCEASQLVTVRSNNTGGLSTSPYFLILTHTHASFPRYRCLRRAFLFEATFSRIQ